MESAAPRKSFAKIAAFCFVEFSFYAMSSSLAYNSVFMDSKGMTPQMVGIITAMGAACSVLGQIVWGIVADKINSSKRTLMLCILCAAAIGLIIPAISEIWVASFPLAALVIPFISFFTSAGAPLTDNWLLGIMKEDPRVQFGRVRMFGSAGSALMGFFVTWLVSQTNFMASYYLFACMAVPTLVVCFFLKEGQRVNTGKKLSLKEMKLGSLFTDYYYRWFILFCVGVFLSMTVGSFHYVLIKEIGGSEALNGMGQYGSYKCIVEIISLMFSAVLIKKFSNEKVLLGISVCYVAEMVYFSLCNSLTMVAIGYCLSGLLYGIVLAAFIQYTDELAPKGLGTSAQSVRGSVFSLTSVISGSIGGSVINGVGIRTYYIICAVIGVLATIWYIFILKRGRAKGILKQCELRAAEK